jgi:hypothetical protein
MLKNIFKKHFVQPENRYGIENHGVFAAFVEEKMGKSFLKRFGPENS